MLYASVGIAANNNKNDVIYVQSLLNKYQDAIADSNVMPLNPDGVCGKKTIAAIIGFQAKVVGFARPDGKVEPGGKSIKTLEKRTGNYSQTPLGANVGVKVVSSAGASPAQQKTATIVPIATASTDPRQLKTRSDIARVYGAISEDKKWARQGEFLAGYSIPTAIQSHKDYNWVNVYSPKKNKVSLVYCHKAMHSFLDKALNNLLARGLLAELKEFGGCHAIRATRGTSNWSAHSWALAIDLNMTGNGLGQKPSLSKEFVQCFTDAGFGWGGYYSRQDGMHFTLAGFDMPRSQK